MRILSECLTGVTFMACRTASRASVATRTNDHFRGIKPADLRADLGHQPS